ncbi:IclR family transcriptional regulator [Rhizobium sp. CG5]|uniref:IclR family transcriptional regulator n=1 Tax=Rhizobium sp. CG5 TaxID=2726076 RepID=UPI0020333C83|nr:IclR family transcriptional regulator [Rhizobium sp. CG5]MCM2477252.1 IclR family transcriptional regulator [Rhizobium sp. CG5]
MDKAFVKGLRLLETLANSDCPRSVTDLSVQLELTRSNVHRMLATLTDQGYVRQLPRYSTYELTTKIWQLGSNVIRRMDVTTLARPAMLKLSEKTGETIHLSILEDTDVVYLDKIEGSHHIRAHTSVGSRAPAWTVATGKAMLAELPDSYLDRFEPLIKPHTSSSKKSVAELLADIKLVRQQGYAAIYHGEWREGIAACACAITDRSGELVGAIGMSGPDSRLKRKQIKQFSSDVMEAARTIRLALGG